MTDKPYEEPKGGSYQVDPSTGEMTLIHRTGDAAPEPAGDGEKTPASREKKGK